MKMRDMKRYISLLRGINVCGQKKIKMAELRPAYTDAGFEQVRSYVQSGNVLFDTQSTPSAKLEAAIAELIAERWGYEVEVLVRTPQQLSRVIAGNPFVGQQGVDPKQLYVTFLAAKPKAKLVKALLPPNTDDAFVVAGQLVYVWCPGGYGRTKLTNKFFERKLQLAATTRNWRTINQLSELAAQ